MFEKGRCVIEMVAETVQEASNLQSDHVSISNNITIFDHNDWS